MSELRGTLPSGSTFAAVVERDMIALAVDGKVCCAHPRWMTPDEARAVASALLAASEAAR